MREKNSPVFAVLFCGSAAVSFLWAAPYLNTIKARESEVSRAEIEEHIQRQGVEQCGIDSSIWKALIEQESGFNNQAYKFEAHVLPKVKGLSKDPREIPMLASSHGVLQIMGYHAVKAGHKWEDLYDLNVSFDIGCKLLRDCYEHTKGAPRSRLANMFACYNGSARYGDQVVKQVEKKMFDGMQIAQKRVNNPHREELDTKGMDRLLARLF